MGKSNKIPKEIYDAIPVFYCKQCLSLRIKELSSDSNVNFCDECNSTNIDTTDIFTWEEMYEQRYGNKYLNTDKNGRE